MPKNHARYAPEYRRRMVLGRAGRGPDDLRRSSSRRPGRFVIWAARRHMMLAVASSLCCSPLLDVRHEALNRPD